MEFLSDDGRRQGFREYDQAWHGNTRALLRPLRAHAIPPVLVCHRLLLRIDSQRDAANSETQLRTCAIILRNCGSAFCRSAALRDEPAAARNSFFSCI